jgi:iron(III) transport system substrate-binding protein
MSRQRITALIAVAVLIGSLLTACGSRGEPGREPLTVYSGRSEQLIAGLLEKFTAETGIVVQARYGDSAELAAQLLEEGAASPAQVFFAQDAGALGAVDEAGLFGPLPDRVADAIPAAYRSPAGTWTGVSGRVRVIAYDGEAVPAAEVPRSIFDLTEPRWKGQVALAPTNASFPACVTAMRVAEGDQVTKQWLERLVDNDVQKFEKNALILDAVNAGQVELGLINHYYWYEKAAEVGKSAMRAQIAFTAPGDPGSLVNVAGVGILASASGSTDAARFVEWLLSAPIQQWFVTNTYEYALLPSVPPAEGLPPLDSLRGPDVALDDLASLPATLAMLEDVGLR